MTFTPFAAPVADYFSNQQFAVGETTVPRLNLGTTAALVSQQCQLSYFTAQKTEICNNIFTITGAVAAAATPTYCAMGIYQVNADNSLTLLAQCANDTTIWAATFTTYSRALTAAFTKVAGNRYAGAVLCVSGVALPTLSGYNGTVTSGATAPRLTGFQPSQSVLPASITAGNVSGSSQMPFVAVTP